MTSMPSFTTCRSYNTTQTFVLRRRRSLPAETHGAGGVWHASTVMPGWTWKGDTSSDEVVGHVLACSTYYHLVANASEKVVAAYVS